jgi:hypothetical protein
LIQELRIGGNVGRHRRSRGREVKWFDPDSSGLGTRPNKKREAQAPLFFKIFAIRLAARSIDVDDQLT